MKSDRSISCKTKTRNSSIELIKIVAIFLIVISHVTQTLNDSNSIVSYNDYIVNLSYATTNIQYLILTILRYSGALGNTIFFVCSAWFLLDSKKANHKKMLQMILDIWVISVLIWIVIYSIRHGNIPFKASIKQFFPTTFSNNWYLTCYLLFYAAHPFLNTIIDRIDQKTLFRCTFVLAFLYIGCNYITSVFFSSDLILWVAIYFVVAYLKFYLPDICSNVKLNLIFLAAGFTGHVGIILFTNFLGLHFGMFQDKLLHWNNNCSPFLILIAISIINISQNIHFYNHGINYLSSLSLLIYIIHENYLLRSYYRPFLWHFIYMHFGYQYILGWTFVLVLIVFLFGLLSSILYRATLQKAVYLFANKIYPPLAACYQWGESIVLQMH